MYAKVYSVESACFNLDRETRQLVVHAVGRTVSTGWTEARLYPWSYVRPPQDGVLDFDLIARAPKTTSLECVSPICGDTTVPAVDWIAGLRLHSTTGTLEIRIDDLDHQARKVDHVDKVGLSEAFGGLP